MSAGEFEGHEALIAQLQAGTLDAPGHLHRRVLAGGQVKRRRFIELSGQRRVLVAVTACAGLAVSAALVHAALTTSPSRSALGSYRAHISRSPASTIQNVQAHGTSNVAGGADLTGRPGPATTPYRDGFQTWTRTEKTFNNYQLADSAKVAAGVETGFSPTTFGPAVNLTNGRLVHADASLTVDVPDHAALANATNRARSIVKQLGGYAQYIRYQSQQGNSGSAILSLRVPLGRVNDAMTSLGKLGTVASSTIATQDLQRQVTKQSDQIAKLQRTIRVYESALQSGTLSGSQRIDVELRLSDARSSVYWARKSRSRTVAYGATAQLTLTLSINRHHAAAVPPQKMGRFGRFFHNAGTFLAVEAIVVLYVLIVVAPIALVFALLWWLMRERRRRDERILAST